MSFSSDIKQILCTTKYQCPGCRRAELAGFFMFPARLADAAAHVFCIAPSVAERIAAEMQTELGIMAHTSGRKIVFEGGAKRIRQSLSHDSVINSCCAAAYCRGAFLAAGSVNNPEKGYHLEFNTASFDEAQFLIDLLDEYNFNPKAARRRDKKLVYLKDSTKIADIIGYMSGGRAGLEILSMQVQKELNSSTQRRVNCDSANLSKLAKASARQIAAIRKIKSARRWSAMPEVLKEIGELRLKYPDMSIEELGKLTKHQIGKSGVNHRLKRIVEYAEQLS